MTDVKHTAGPWLIHGALLGHKGDVFSPTAEKVTDCHHIARCYAPKPTEPVLSDLHAIGVKREAIAIIEANARLIAAAPDLLEALIALRAACIGMVPECAEQVDAAIAKASGETP